MPMVHDAGVDYVTLTLKKGDKSFDSAVAMCEKMLTDYAAGGEEAKPSNLQGYQGFTVGRLFAGWRDDGLMIRASSEVAKYVESVVRESGIRFRCTRLDLQVTAKLRPEEADVAQRVCEARAGSERPNGRKKAATSVIYKNSHVYSGLSLGSRVSGRFARLYDKSLEQRGLVEDGLWRYECEFKRKLADYLWAALMKAPRGYWFACSIVKAEFEGHGVDMAFIESATGIEMPSSYEPTSEEKKLGWLENHVRSSVLWLIERGKREDVIRALGLQV